MSFCVLVLFSLSDCNWDKVDLGGGMNNMYGLNPDKTNYILIGV